MYINAASTISHQPTFRNAGFSELIEPLDNSSELISPNYKEYIDAGLLRRMSKILRMSVAAAKDCLTQAETAQPGAIIVGTGLGCLQDTEKFLNTFLSIEGLLPPTSFIQSTHNTIAGQISLSIGNHGYNMTHTQNTLSFEHALIDTSLLLGEGKDNIITGAADEFIAFLDEAAEHLNASSKHHLTSGASFFILGKNKTEKSVARVKDVRTAGLIQDIDAAIDSFLLDNFLNISEVDLVLYSDFSEKEKMDSVAHQYFNEHYHADSKLINYTKLSGLYPTNSAFAMHYAVDRIQREPKLKNVLILNGLNKINLGLTLIESLEA
ncbi:beta-ketoacyl synthase chain length factor [Dyadobacter sp. CY345]|uniref:beta-ketoacyl synthase chain length factor n=1 Tax=Dyadobacter sp. CY345 TaxID=2909335 RepID=UPI001F44E8AE|nr:beta-ketoacyl synthase chain length factor [Dyadobacter sp. CY345]MCF2447546.1 beta-ketoacyl synthase chain length factor [Dyadobacter sp. CY345]